MAGSLNTQTTNGPATAIRAADHLRNFAKLKVNAAFNAGFVTSSPNASIARRHNGFGQARARITRTVRECACASYLEPGSLGERFHDAVLNWWNQIEEPRRKARTRMS